MTALVDTCVIIDALANRVPFCKDAQELILRGAERKISLFVSAKSFLDVHYILKHYLNNEMEVRSRLNDLLQAITVVDTSAPACIAALNSPNSDYEDAVQIETALYEGVDYVVTRDCTGYSISSVPSLNATSILSILDQGSEG